MFFLTPEINYVFFGNRQQSNARAEQKKNTCFFGNALPKSNDRSHLIQRKKHSSLKRRRDLLNAITECNVN